MNKARTSERWTRLLALICTISLYVVLIWGVGLWAERLLNPDPVDVSVSAVKLSFVQMELMATEEAQPELELPPPEEVDVALEEIVKKPEPEPEPVVAEAQVTQAAAAPEPEVNSADLQAWIFEQFEQEKYYPVSAQRAGFEGTFQLLVTVDSDGTIISSEILSGKGHVLLRRAVEKIGGKLIGRNFDRPLDKLTQVPIKFKLELE